MTTCVTCKHLIDRNRTNRPAMWYDLYCGAVTLPKRMDPVSGEMGYASKNDFGTTIIDDEPHPHCRDINDGNCPHYEPLGDA